MMIIPGGGARDLINQRSPEILQKSNLKNLLMKTQAIILTKASSIQHNEQQVSEVLEPTSCRSSHPCPLVAVDCGAAGGFRGHF